MPMSDFRDKGDRAEDHMIPVSELKVIDGKSSSLRELGPSQFDSSEYFARLKQTIVEYAVVNFDVDGFPVVVDGLLLGYAPKDAITNAIGP